MATIIKADKLDPQSGTALELGSSGDSITVPSGATFAVSGTMNASSITAGTLAVARGGTGAATFAAAGLSNTPAFFVHKNAVQSITNTTWSQVSFQTETLDSDSAYNTTDFKFTPQTAGWYYLFASISWNTATDIDATYIGINKNGTGDDAESTAFVPNTNYNSLKTAVLVEANGSSDYFCVSTYQASGGSINTTSDVTQNYFAGYRIIGA